jgi:orotidine-5'-phosphate decarboxylase
MTDTDREKARGRLIFALDVPGLASASEMLDQLEGQVGLVKVGMELFTACGPAAIEVVLKRNLGVFLDLKFHDIPNTVAGAVRSARTLGVSMLTVHTSGGKPMLARAVEEADGKITVLGVTLLTSMGSEDLPPIAVAGSTSEVVQKRAIAARESGLQGIVCSPKEIEVVRTAVGPDLSIVTPGIRPAGASMGDQKRAATPATAIASGADYLVIGRPISGADSPSAAAAQIVGEIQMALSAK